MLYISKSTRVIPNLEADRRRESTVSHVLNGWFPSNPDTLGTMLDRLECGEYSNHPDLLLSDLKSDLAIFGKLIPALKPGEESEHGFISPITALQNLSQSELEQIFPRSPYRISKHSIQRGTPTTNTVLNCSLTSATAAETFAVQAQQRGAQISIDDTFCSSLLRQLGLNLLAWNYPALFSRIARSFKNSPEEQDRALKQMFGYTPLTLAIELSRRWQLTPRLRSSLANDNPLQINSGISELCDLGDLFGRRQHRSLFPSADKEWEERKERLSDLIGTESTSSLEERIEHQLEQRLSRFFSEQPAQFNMAFRKARPVRKDRVALWMTNPFIKALPENLGDAFAPVYESLESEPLSIDALTLLTHQVLPISGFSRGVVCFTDSDKEPIEPKIRIGVRARDQRILQSLIATASANKDSHIPLLNLEALPNGETVTRISSRFQSPSHQGVLVLELANGRSESAAQNNVALFKAVRSCFEHCLG